MNALPILIGAIGALVLGYRFYGAFIAAKVLALDDSRVTPAHRFKDGHNFVPMNKWVLFGHHFAAIAGAGPLVGPVLAAQFGWAPGFLWLVAGAVLAGCVQDFVVLAASVRHGGRSLAEIARAEIGPVAGVAAGIAVLFIAVIGMGGLGIVVVNALAASPWGTFTIAMTIPIALAMGVTMFRLRPGSVKGPSLCGVAALIACVVAGRWVAHSGLASAFTFDHRQLTVLMAIYGFAASVLPVWLLLAPRDYLSSYMKIGTVAALVLGVLWVHPDLLTPATTEFVRGGGPIIPGPLFPFLFVTIACGAISGYHSLVSSGTTPKMLDREGHARLVGYGAMAVESLVGVVALVAACSLSPGDYYCINIGVEKAQAIGFEPVHLEQLSRDVGEDVAGRPGGAVTLAVGMAEIFSRIPGMRHLMSYWYHFAIMFEALFILTVIDAGTRIGRFLLQEFLGRFHKPFARAEWLPGSVLTTGLIVLGWGYLVYTGNIATIWPMFGIANQLMAVAALSVATTYLVNRGKARYAWVTALPMAIVACITLAAGFLAAKNSFIPLALEPGKAFQGWLNVGMTGLMMSMAVIILADSARRWVLTAKGHPPPSGDEGRPEVREDVPQRCC